MNPDDVKSNITISVYLDTGVVREYTVTSHASAREHVAQIVKTGYRFIEGDKLTHVPPHKIDKVCAQGPGINTKYPDRVRGT